MNVIMRRKLLGVTAICLGLSMFVGCSNAKPSTEQEKPAAEVSQKDTASDKVSENNTSTNTNTAKNDKTVNSTKTNSTNASKISNAPKGGAAKQQSTDKKESDRYSVAGIDNAAEFEKTFNTVKDLVAKNNKTEVAKYVMYPINAYIDGKKTAISKEADFVKNYDKIMNAKVKKALANQNVANTFVNQYGVMVGQGELWFSQFNNNPKKYCIYGINNQE
jgi:hypothetical protein